MSTYFEQSCVWDLATRNQVISLKSLNALNYSFVIRSIEDYWLENGFDYEAAMNIVLGETNE
jgi:hypothetical protein